MITFKYDTELHIYWALDGNEEFGYIAHRGNRVYEAYGNLAIGNVLMSVGSRKDCEQSMREHVKTCCHHKV